MKIKILFNQLWVYGASIFVCIILCVSSLFYVKRQCHEFDMLMAIIKFKNIAALETFWVNKKTNLSYVHLYYSYLPWREMKSLWEGAWIDNPISVAIGSNKIEHAIFLLDHGVRPNINVLRAALRGHHWEVAKKLITNYHLPINALIYHNDYLSDGKPVLLCIGAIELANIAGAVSDRDKFLNIELYPTYYAGMETELSETIHALIELGMDVNQMYYFEDEDIGCFTPLMAAATNGYVEVVKILLTKGADSQMKFYGKTAREWCLELQKKSVMQNKIFHVNDLQTPPNLEYVIEILEENEKNKSL